MNAWTQERNTAMKVFSELYVGLQSRSDDKVPLGFATPLENNAAGRKRQDTVNNWCTGYGKWVDGKLVQGTPNTRIVQNKPRGGFRITDDIKRVYWGGGNVVWRVEDPDGFELEIQSNNLMAIIQTAGINEGGLIPGYCMWGRSGGDNILLHEKSDEYRDAVLAAETLKAPKQVGKAARQVGGAYRLVDGSIGLFVGKVHVCRVMHPEGKNYGTIRAKFPDVPNMLPNAKTTGMLNFSTYTLEPSTEFEAVISIPEQGRLGGSMKLYKKAPLVDFIETMPVEINNAFLDSFAWEFASSAITAARITSVTVDPITNPVIKLLPWTEKQYAAAREEVVRRATNDNFKYYGAYFGGWFKSNEHAVMLGDVLCGGLGVAGTYDTRFKKETGGARSCFAIGMQIGVGCYTVATATNDVGNIYSTDRYAGMQWRSWSNTEEVIHSDPATIVLIPGIDSAKDYLEFFDRLYNERSLFTIVTR